MSFFLSDYDKRRIKFLYAQGWSVSDIAQDRKRCPDTVRKYLREHRHDADATVSERETT